MLICFQINNLRLALSLILSLKKINFSNDFSSLCSKALPKLLERI